MGAGDVAFHVNSLLLLFWVLLTFAKGAFTSRPNVLFMVVDDLRPALGTYGDPNAFTPNIDKLAKDSFVFTNAFAQQALCAPSRNSLLTGRRPDSLHLYDFYSYWRDSVGNFTTLPQHFKENGYYTHSIGKVFHPGASSNFSDDFPYSWSDQPFHPKTDKYKDAEVCVAADGKLARNLLCPIIVQDQPEGTLPDLESALDARLFLLQRANASENHPYFLAVGFHKPHIPLKFPVEYLDFHPIEEVVLPTNRWQPPLLPTVAWNPWLDVKRRDDIKKLNITFPFGRMPDDVMKRVIQHYNAATTYIDDLIGGILNLVDLKNTIVVLTSDQGWSRGEHGEFSKFSNFDVTTRVPLIIHVPGLNPLRTKQTVNQLVELVDLFPTLVDLTEVSKPLEVCTRNGSNSQLCTEGASMVPLMTKPSPFQPTSAKSVIYSQYPRPGSYPTEKPDSDRPRLDQIKIMGYSMRTERYRYAEWIKFNHTGFSKDWTEVFGRELYDHSIDPDENMNLVSRPELQNITSTLRKQLILGWRYSYL